MVDELKRTLEDKRCQVCGRFIPHGWHAYTDHGKAWCATHLGVWPLNKATSVETDEIGRGRNTRSVNPKLTPGFRGRL